MTAFEIPGLFARLRADEGVRDRPYRCSKGKLTIGVGHNIDANPLPPAMALRLKTTGRITPADIETLLAVDAGKAVAAARRIFPSFDALTAPRQVVLASMVFQRGPASVMAFKTFRADVAAGRFEAASVSMLQSKWARKDTPARAKRLAALMRSG